MNKLKSQRMRQIKFLSITFLFTTVFTLLILLILKLPLFDDRVRVLVEENVHNAVLRQLAGRLNDKNNFDGNANVEISPFPTPKSVVKFSPTLPPTIAEAELWLALSSYRQAHQMNSLVLEEPLCVYARGRVRELEERLLTLTANDSPLDAHAGFKRDADSKKLFNDTGFPAVAENLAYLPKYITATEIIEWGWDSSSSHRDTQLSNDWTHACIAGTFPFYVGIFAHR